MAFRLTAGQVADSIEDRFGRWGRFLRKRHAVPSLVLGITADGTDQVVVCTCEGSTDAQLAEMLELAIHQLRRGEATEVP